MVRETVAPAVRGCVAHTPLHTPAVTQTIGCELPPPPSSHLFRLLLINEFLKSLGNSLLPSLPDRCDLQPHRCTQQLPRRPCSWLSLLPALQYQVQPSWVGGRSWACTGKGTQHLFSHIGGANGQRGWMCLLPPPQSTNST